MTRCLIMPDSHLHVALLEEIAHITHDPAHRIDAVVSLGDWCDDWDATRKDYNYFFDALMEHIADAPVPYYLCWGNHDYGYVYNHSFSGKADPATARHIVSRLHRLSSSFGPLLPFLKDANTIFSHAGISQAAHAASPDHSFPDLWADDSPLWGRPRHTLADTFDPSVLQVVGHTPVATVTHNPNTNILYTDTWSDCPDHTPIGDHTLAIVDTVTQQWEVV